jgi:hypothetical protein
MVLDHKGGIGMRRMAWRAWTTAAAALTLACGGLAVTAGAAAAATATIPAGYGEAPGFCATVVSSGMDLGNGSTSYDNVYPCGPQPGGSSPDYGDSFQPSGGFQCTELANRFLFDVWGLRPIFGTSLDGKTFAQSVHVDYPSVPLVSNGTPGRPYLPGDIVSFTGNSNEPDGHVAVVIASTENSSGNGTVTIMEENAATSGKETLKVSDWKLLPAAGAWVTPSNFDALATGTTGSGASPPAGPAIAINPSTGLATVVAEGPSNSLYGYWQSSSGSWEGPIGIDGGKPNIAY